MGTDPPKAAHDEPRPPLAPSQNRLCPPTRADSNRSSKFGISKWLEIYEVMTATRATTPEQQRLKEIAIGHLEQRPE